MFIFRITSTYHEKNTWEVFANASLFGSSVSLPFYIPNTSFRAKNTNINKNHPDGFECTCSNSLRILGNNSCRKGRNSIFVLNHINILSCF